MGYVCDSQAEWKMGLKNGMHFALRCFGTD